MGGACEGRYVYGYGCDVGVVWVVRVRGGMCGCGCGKGVVWVVHVMGGMGVDVGVVWV